MATFFDRLRSIVDGRTLDQRDNLALARFQGVCDALEQVKARLPLAQTGAGQPYTGATVRLDAGPGPMAGAERALALYALAWARMQFAEQLSTALRKEIEAGPGGHPSQTRMDLEDLTGQIDVLALAAGMELAQPNSTAGDWETEHRLREAVNPPRVSERGEDALAHARALYNGGLVLLTQLQQQLAEREAAGETANLGTARSRLAEAQHLFDTLRPLDAELRQSSPRFRPGDARLHEEIEERVERMARALESAAAELAVPGVTQTPFWKELFDNRPAGVAGGSRRAAADRSWARDIWYMTSDLFKRTNYGEPRATRVLNAMWNSDPDPTTTVALYESVKELERQGAVRPIGSFFNACPWTDIWSAQRTVRVGNKVVFPGQEFCLHIESEPGGGFSREVIVGDFQPTDELDYCDTDEGGHGRRH